MIFNKLSAYKKLIALEVFFQLIEKTVRVIFGVIVVKKISYYLGPADFGNLNFIESFFTLLMGISIFGMDVILVKKFLTQTDNDYKEKIFINGFILIFLTSLFSILFSVILFNYQNIIPSFISIFAEVFSGSAAIGGFLGASISFAISRGVNRGLYSNEAGQGSAPIAHASAKTNEPVSEGLVAILEPFIDTIIICTITGLVLLSSGVWNQKHQNTFAQADLLFLDKVYSEDNKDDVNVLFNYLNGNNSSISFYDGNLKISDGVFVENISIIHARSIAEEILIYNNEGNLYSGNIRVEEGKLQDDFIVKGKSLVHSAPLTAIAFDRGFFGNYGNYIVSIGLLLFAFSTAISWSYYGDRAMTFLFGSGSVIYYRVIYVIGFFVASFADTTVIWNVSLITIALMTVPNLIGLLWLRKEVRSTIKKYWMDFKKEWPEEDTPE